MMRTVVFAAGLVALVAPLGAQSPRAVRPGERVRLSAPVIGKEKLVAGVLSIRNNSLVVQVAGRTDSVAIALNDIRSLDRSKGMRRQFWRTFLIGTTAGSALGAGIGYVLPAKENPSRVCFRYGDSTQTVPCNPHAVRDANVIIGMMLLGSVGEIGGIVVGLTRRVERWERMKQSDWVSRVSIAPAPSHGFAGRGVAVRVAF